MERLNKLIAHSGLASRRTAEEWIRQGRVTVDGERAVLGQKVDPSTAQIRVDGLPLPVAPDLVHYLLYKPVGVISSVDDPHGRPTVVDLVPAETRVYPVGRLDADSEGLLILTNDGSLTELLTHPRFGVTKTYTVMVDGTPSPGALRKLVTGIELDDGPARAKRSRVIDSIGESSLIEVVMTEGRKREVRRMMDVIGHPVRRLVRTAIGPLRDTMLEAGRYRPLTIAEIRALYDAAVTAWDDGAAHFPDSIPP